MKPQFVQLLALAKAFGFGAFAQRCVLAQGVRFGLGLSFSLLFGEALLLLANMFGFGAFSRSDAFLLKAFGFCLGLSFSLLLARRSCSWRRRSASARSAAAMRSCSRRSAFALASASACSLARRSCSWQAFGSRSAAAMRSCSRRSAFAWPQLQLALWRGALALGEGVRLRRVQPQRCVLAQGVRLLLGLSFSLLFGEALFPRRRSASARSAAAMRSCSGVRLLPWPQLQLALGEALLLWRRRSASCAFSRGDAFLLKAFGFGAFTGAMRSCSGGISAGLSFCCSLANRSCAWRLRSASAACWAWRR